MPMITWAYPIFMGLQIKPFVWSDYERLAAEDGEKIIDTCKKVFLSAPQNYGTYGHCG